MLFDWHLFVLSSATALIAAAGYIINDYYDIKIDLVKQAWARGNRSRRYPKSGTFLHTLFSYQAEY